MTCEKRRTETSLLVMLVWSALAATGSASEPTYRPLDAEISQVQAGGVWTKGGENGTYRAIVRRRCSAKHCYYDLFVDWVRESRDGPRVVMTRQIAEVGGFTNVSNLRFVLSNRRTRLEVRHASAGGEVDGTMCLDLGLPGAYTARQGTCT